MLQLIRDHAQGVIVWSIVGLIIITFALFGLSSYLSGSSSSFVASVNGVEISEQEFRIEQQRYRARLEQLLGKNYRADMFQDSMIKSEVVNTLVMRELMTQYIADENFNVAASRIISELKNVEAFHDANQKFDPERYKTLIRQQGMSEAVFEQQVSRDIASRYLQAGITQTEFATDSEAKLNQQINKQQREIAYLTIAKNEYLNTAQASKQDVESYYNSNKNEFMTEELVSVEYVELKLEDAAKKFDVSDEEVRKYYDANIQNYVKSPEQRKARHILIKVDQKKNEKDALKEIEDIRSKIKSGQSFAEMAKKHSQDPGSAKQGGDLGFFGLGVMDKAFEKTAFELKKGQLSKPVRSSFGYHLIKVDEIKAKQAQAYKDVRSQIKKEMQMQQAEQAFYSDVDQLSNLAYEQSDSLQPAVEQLGLTIKSTSLFSRRGGAGIAANNKVSAAAFSADVLLNSRNSEMLELTDTHVLVLRVKDHRPAELKKLAQVKAKIQSRLKDKTARKQVSENTQLALKKLNAGEKPSAVAAAIKGAKWQKRVWVNRNVADDKSAEAKKIDAAVRRFSFKIPKPANDKASWSSTMLANGNGAVVGLYKVKKPDIKNNADELNKSKQRIVQAQGNEMYSQMLKELKQHADIKINLPKESEE
ncbi:MAG: SurA N-terminal domain-containing protein [Gammaproteobacteria bacterium]|nr:SurA N-terminal domain-containing protein [Gammaproteobacteria bacterium]